MSKIVVLGANGFIGKHLVRNLAESEEDEITAFGHFSKYQIGEEHPFVGLSNVSIVAGDFFNRSDIAPILDGADYVFHFISSTNPAASNNDPIVDIDTNIRNSVELFELCSEKGVKKIIFPSSGGTVYGNLDSARISENDIPKPQSPYGIGKLTLEHYLRYFKANTDMDYVVYRIANPYGPGQNIYGRQGVIPIFMHKFLVGSPLTIYGDGSMVRDYVYIDDLVKLIINSYSKPHRHNEYNLGSGEGTSVNQIIQAIESCTDIKPDKETLETPKSFVYKSVLDTTRYRDEFGEISLTSLDEGIKRTWEYVKKLS